MQLIFGIFWISLKPILGQVTLMLILQGLCITLRLEAHLLTGEAWAHFVSSLISALLLLPTWVHHMGSSEPTWVDRLPFPGTHPGVLFLKVFALSVLFVQKLLPAGIPPFLHILAQLFLFTEASIANLFQIASPCSWHTTQCSSLLHFSWCLITLGYYLAFTYLCAYWSTLILEKKLSEGMTSYVLHCGISNDFHNVCPLNLLKTNK